ncbi:Spt20 family-domain-containing protein [Pterulicium gracile]|uniref:Spt20 family-domain-containing protein n=1 Tax=Pterulicium gracile TaxID=1884261 RepID=A0A5C3QKX9_9AGAR|nr:Spt20 family-domain-containing protein [Pterula gracilis]
MAYYNCTRQVDALLESTQHKPPSFTIHLHSEHWTLNNGSKFLYNNQIASLLDDVRAHRIPVDFLDLFDKVGVPFYEGCLVVELLDYRAKPVQRSAKENNAASNHTANPPAPNASVPPVPPQPERMRVVLHPNSETLWSDVCAMNAKAEKHWTDAEALEVEAKILLATSSSLCLDPDPHLTRIANHVLRVSMPTVPQSLKRKAATQDKEEDETEKARRAKIMQFMNPRMNRVHAARYFQVPTYCFKCSYFLQLSNTRHHQPHSNTGSK